jgi:hypothetical protein
MKVLHANICGVKYSLNLIASNVLCSKTVREHNCLKHQMSLHRVTGQTLLATRERTLKSTHTPLNGLPKGHVNIANPKEVVTNVTMKMSCGPFCHRPDKHPICIPTLMESLVETDFIAPNLCLKMTLK